MLDPGLHYQDELHDEQDLMDSAIKNGHSPECAYRMVYEGELCRFKNGRFDCENSAIAEKGIVE